MLSSFVIVAACAGRSLDERPRGGETSGTGGTGGKGGTGGGTGGTVGGWGGTCFEAGSRVATPFGSVPIEMLRVGDEVLAFDSRTGAVVPRPLVATHVHETTRSGLLALADGRMLRVTPEHPIFLPRTQRYERAGSLRAADELFTLSVTQGPAPDRALRASSGASEAALIAVTASLLTPTAAYEARDLDAPVTVYNLSVADLETYFVEGVLVHNKSGATGGGSSGLGGTAGTGAGIGGAGFGGTAGTFEIAGASGETCMHGDLNAGSCDRFAGCLDPLSPEPDFIPLNRPVVTGGNGGAAGEGGAANEAGTGNTDGPTPGSTALELLLCEPRAMLPPDASYFLAYDLFLPDRADDYPVVPLLAGSDGDCGGIITGEVYRDSCAPPAPGTTTTQCLRLDENEVKDLLLVASEADALALVSNPRFVSGCACALEHFPYCEPSP